MGREQALGSGGRDIDVMAECQIASLPHKPRFARTPRCQISFRVETGGGRNWVNRLLLCNVSRDSFGQPASRRSCLTLAGESGPADEAGGSENCRSSLKSHAA